jgi:hypothetical protein
MSLVERHGLETLRPRGRRHQFDSPGFAHASELLIRAATSAPFEGRPQVRRATGDPDPDDVVARLFHAASLLREHRGNGRIAALMIEGQVARSKGQLLELRRPFGVQPWHGHSPPELGERAVRMILEAITESGVLPGLLPRVAR